MTAPIRRRISCWRRMSRAVGRAGLSTRGLMMAAASSAASLGAELGCRFVKIGARRRLGAVDAVAPLDHVQIQLENPRFLQLGFEPPRDDQLAQLAQRILRRREIEVLRELLRDRAAAAHEAGRAPSRPRAIPAAARSRRLRAARTRRLRRRAPRASARARCGCSRPTAARAAASALSPALRARAAR